MSTRASRQGTCDVSPRGAAVSQFAFTAEEWAVLQIARHYFASFAAPASQGWLRAIATALEAYDHETAPHVAVAVLGVVQTMRQTRRSVFGFNSPDCIACCRHLTLAERSLMNAIRSAARRQDDRARAHAAFLCEGNDTRAFMRALDTLTVTALRGEGVTACSPNSAPLPQGMGG